MAKNITLTAKDKFNALANAKHIFAFKEEETKIQILEVIDTPDGTKAVVMTEDGEISGLFTNSASAKSALHEVVAVFGNERPFVQIKIRETAKKQSVYYVEVV